MHCGTTRQGSQVISSPEVLTVRFTEIYELHACLTLATVKGIKKGKELPVARDGQGFNKSGQPPETSG